MICVVRNVRFLDLIEDFIDKIKDQNEKKHLLEKIRTFVTKHRLTLEWNELLSKKFPEDKQQS